MCGSGSPIRRRTTHSRWGSIRPASPATGALDSSRDFADVARTGVLSVAPTAEARTVAEAALAPLVRHDREHGTALLETVRAWLDHDCSHEASARALGVHRHTVRARIAAAERALDVDLGSFAARAELWAALRIAA